MMFVLLRRGFFWIGFAILSAAPAFAAQAKLDKETCTQLGVEQVTFIQSGILADLQRGPSWGKANLSADRLREIEHYILLDEQIKFACRQATLTPEMERAGEIAKKLELNSDADPFAPPAEKNGAEKKAAAGEAAAVASDAPSGLAPAPDVKPSLKPKAVRRAGPADDAAKPAVKPAAKSDAKADDALKVAPTHIAPPLAKPASGAVGVTPSAKPSTGVTP